MTKREFAMALYCHQHCSDRSCTDCYELSGEGCCPCTKEYNEFLRNFADTYFESHKGDILEDEISFSDLAAIFDSQLD